MPPFFSLLTISPKPPLSPGAFFSCTKALSLSTALSLLARLEVISERSTSA
jgi:hypothetical protein